MNARTCNLSAVDISQMTTSNFSIGKSNAGHHATEMISFLWELIQCNKRFRRYLCETKVGMDYLVIFLFYARDSVSDETKQGLMRMVIFVIQSLSAEAAFCAKLNTPFLHVSSLPPVMRIENFHGSYADFLICVCFSHALSVDRLLMTFSQYTASSRLRKDDSSQCILRCLISSRMWRRTQSICNEQHLRNW